MYLVSCLSSRVWSFFSTKLETASGTGCSGKIVFFLKEFSVFFNLSLVFTELLLVVRKIGVNAH